MKNWSEESAWGRIKNSCPWQDEVRDVRKVCHHLGIPMKIYNFEPEYRTRVMNPFFSDTASGLTPNPDVKCNREIKFGLFLRKALSEGADFVATGHYARLKINDSRGKKIIRLISARDTNKDQTYFLCQLRPSQLSRVIFPIGKLTKPQVRAIAKRAGLPTADKAESMGICFVGEVPIKKFLRSEIKSMPGQIVNTRGEPVGRHDGLAFYTIGQRQGLNIGGGPAYYVAAKDRRRNRLIVCEKNDPALYQKWAKLKSWNWSIQPPPRLPVIGLARIRHRQPFQKGKLAKTKNGAFIFQFKNPQKAVTPGQYCAVYRKGELIGGGEIARFDR